MTSLNLEKMFIIPPKITLSWIPYISIIKGAMHTMQETKPNTEIINETIKMYVFLIKNVNSKPGTINTKDEILKILFFSLKDLFYLQKILLKGLQLLMHQIGKALKIVKHFHQFL